MLKQCMCSAGLDEGDIVLIQSVVKKGKELPGDCGDEYR